MALPRQERRPAPPRGTSPDHGPPERVRCCGRSAASRNRRGSCPAGHPQRLRAWSICRFLRPLCRLAVCSLIGAKASAYAARDLFLRSWREASHAATASRESTLPACGRWRCRAAASARPRLSPSRLRPSWCGTHALRARYQPGYERPRCGRVRTAARRLVLRGAADR